MQFENLKIPIVQILDSPNSVKVKLQQLCDFLQREKPHYTWVGFYFMNHETQTLHLGPFAGKPTEHIEIPFGKGICGQVAVSGENYISDDVAAESNYISCSHEVRSEIVLPIFNEEKLVAQLDIDSNTPEAFTEKDRKFLLWVCEEVARAGLVKRVE